MERLIELFCHVDDFCKVFIPKWNKIQIAQGTKKRQREKKLSTSEMITILLRFQSSNYRNFKRFYLCEILGNLKSFFPNAVTYSRFVNLISSVMIPLCSFLQSIKSTSEGISFIDSTSIIVCHTKRISKHKVFDGLAHIGKTTKGWFLGFKLHLVINHRGELCDCKITPANIDDRAAVRDLTDDIYGRIYGDKGYIDKKVFEELFSRGLKLVTGIRKKMKNQLMILIDKILLRKRTVAN